MLSISKGILLSKSVHLAYVLRIIHASNCLYFFSTTTSPFSIRSESVYPSI